ncbi:hypothetical protein ACTA71_001919 [Dictyostelium dimigraforme]
MNTINLIIYLFIFWIVFDFIRKNRRLSKNDPPSPWALPIIGHLHKLSLNPHRSFTELAKVYGGVYSLHIGDSKTVVITDPIAFKDVTVKQFKNFVNRPQPKSIRVIKDFIGLAFADYEHWQKTRKLVSAALTKTKIKTFNNLIEKQTENLIESMKEFSNKNESFYPRKYLTKYSLNIILSMLFSREIGKNESINKGTMERLTIPFNEAFKKVGKVDDFLWFLSPLFYFSNKKYRNYIYDIYYFMEEIYDQHLQELDRDEPKDLLDQLIIASEGKEKETVVLIGIDFLLAGSDTQKATQEWFILYLINNPQVQKKAYQELIGVVGKDCKFVTLNHIDNCPYLVSIIKEVFRIRSPGPLGLPRISMNDTYLTNGMFIPKGTQILLNIFGMGNLLVSDPDQFKPERWIDYKNQQQQKQQQEKKEDNENLVDNNEISNNNGLEFFDDLDKVSNPFSLGPRNCVGMAIAKSSIFSVCSNILLNFELNSINNEKIDDYEVFGVSINPKEFSIKLTSRS